MEQNEHDRTKKALSMSRGLRDLLLEASEDELRNALADAGEDFDSIATRGRAAVERAMGKAADPISATRPRVVFSRAKALDSPS